ncbi:hypothetical protein [Parasutterella muris]|uniref:hypothetical protein n=1 Tax=Parasutterella muris TaxID=2565572 RepID=UPI00203FAB03|nr:hypothetical protein [Parasutterella muris]
MYIAQCFYVAIQTGDVGELNAKEQAALFRFLGSVDGNVVLDVEDPEFDIDDDVEFCICSICGLLAACVPVRIERWEE